MSPQDRKIGDILGKVAFALIVVMWLAFGIYTLHLDGKL